MNYAKDITQEYTASYASYVATSRAIPQLVDGLKPVNRRCINSADDLRLYHDKKFLKVAKLEGQVMGDYHPHGGASPVILAQPFKTRYPLFEGQGNFGSPDEPNSVAASRYIECRLTKFCEDFYLSSSDYADREDNYDGRLKEVVRYYPPIPGSLLTGSSGIAVGLSTNIPTHTIKDVCNSMLSYIDNPKSRKYIQLISPDTCEESIIMTPKSEIENLYLRGEGSIQYKAKTHYESIEGKLALVVDAFPPDYSKKRLETSYILEAVESGNLELRNESKESVRYVFLSQDKSILEAVEERLVSSTGYRMYIEHEGKIKCYKLSELYDDFIEARINYITRKYTALLDITSKEHEYLSILVRVKSDKEYIKSLLDMTSDEAIESLKSRYDINKDIALRIINTSLRSLMKDNIELIEAQIKNLLEKMEECKEFIGNPLSKLKLDVKELLSTYKNEKRRAVHIDDVSNKITLNYRGSKIEVEPTAQFFFFDSLSNQNHVIISATDLASQENIDWMTIVSTDYEYYVMYDEQGLAAFTKDIMMRLENKFKSDHLVGVIGTNDLTKIDLHRSNTKKIITLGDWALRTRLSYIKQVDEGSIKLVAHN